MTALALVACGSDEPDRTTSAGEPPAPDAGPESGCPPGEMAAESGCRPAGIDARDCGDGFEPTGDGSCTAVLPPGLCPDGTLAVPGEARCRPVAACEGGPWGAIPMEADTEHVDGSYQGADADGSPDKPWTTVGDGVAAAADGALVAIAAGTYAEDVVLTGKRVRLWGRCPGEVEIRGLGAENGALSIGPGADGSEVHRVALTGVDNGLFVDGAEQVLVTHVWIHDNGDRGVGAQGTLGATQMTLEDSLVENAYGGGLIAIGVPVEVRASSVRETRIRSDGTGGRGIHVFANPNDRARGTLALRGSVVERNADVGVRVAGADAAIEGSVLRDTAPTEAGSYGSGLYVIDDADTGQPATALVRGSLLERNHHAGVMVGGGSQATIETTVVRETFAHVSADGRAGVAGLGVNVLRGELVLRSSVVEHNRKLGVFVSGSKATFEGVLIRDTLQQDADGENGRGLNVQADPETGARASVQVLGSVIERSREMGMFVAGSDALVDGTRISDTAPQASDLRFGRGVNAQQGLGDVASITLVRSRIERSHDVGVFISIPGAVIEGCTIADTAPRASDGAFGDGVGVFAARGSADALLRGVRVERSARAGVGSFGAEVTLADTTLECNSLALNGEELFGAPPKLVDQGGNVCGCEGQTEACQMQSAGLAPPDPADVSSE